MLEAMLQGPSILHFSNHPGMCLQLLAGNAAFGAAVFGALYISNSPTMLVVC